MSLWRSVIKQCVFVSGEGTAKIILDLNRTMRKCVFGANPVIVSAEEVTTETFTQCVYI